MNSRSDDEPEQPFFSFKSNINFCLAKQLAKHLGGKIWVSNSIQSGISIFLRIPVLALKEPLKGNFNEGYNSLLHKKIKGRSTSVQQDLESLTKTP